MENKVIVYGVKDRTIENNHAGCTCGCSVSEAGTQPTMGELFESLKAYLQERMTGLEYEFVDVLEDSLEEHKDARELLELQYPIPYTKIKGKISFYGAIFNEVVYEDLNS